MSVLQKSRTKVSSRTQIDIKGAKDNILILPANQYRTVLQVSSVNFELRSEDEQDAIISTYESVLNAIGVPLQILIRTREIDMDKYLEDLNERHKVETEQVYQEQLRNYDVFIRSLVKNNRIPTRHFYVVIPFQADKKMDFEQVKEQLHITTDIVAKSLTRLGIRSRQLKSLEILELFYSFYNPTQAKLQPLTEQALALINETFTRGEVR